MTETVSSSEQSMSQERLSQILRDSAVTVHGWFTANEIPDKKRTGTGKYQDLRNVAQAASTYQSHKEILGQFIAQDITEVITIHKPKNPVPTGRYRQDSSKADEPVIGISFEAATEGYDSSHVKKLQATMDKEEWNDKFLSKLRFANSKPLTRFAPTSIFRMFLAMPESDATEWVEAVLHNPQLARDTVDLAMHQEIEATKTWDEDGTRPPYDEWREATGGVAKIALRKDMNAGPDQSIILEF